MVFLRYLLWWGGAGMIAAAVAILARDLFLSAKYKQSLATATPGTTPAPVAPTIHWRQAVTLGALAWLPTILSYGIVVVPSGMAGVRVSQTSGTQPGTLYPGAHFVTPLVDNVVLFDTRDQLFTTGELESSANRSQEVRWRRASASSGQRRTDHRPRHHRPLPPRSQTSRLHPEQSSAARGERNRSAGGRQRMARNRPELHRARCFRHQARGDPAKSCLGDRAEARC